jgi:transcriptional regulator with XRE-family HTH domain
MEVPLKTRFGRLLAAHRKVAGMTQAKLAERSSTSVDMIAKMEAGATAPSFDTIDRLSNALSVDAAEFFTTELGGKPYKRRAFTGLVSELAKLSDADLKWLSGVVKAALRTRS